MALGSRLILNEPEKIVSGEAPLKSDLLMLLSDEEVAELSLLADGLETLPLIMSLLATEFGESEFEVFDDTLSEDPLVSLLLPLMALIILERSTLITPVSERV